MLRTPPRRTAGLVVSVLALATLPVLLVASGSTAAPACPAETAPGPGATGCDDAVPPETTITSTTPAVTSSAYASSTTVTFAFSGAYTDGDTGPITFECEFYNATTDPGSYQTCVSPQTFPNLVENGATPYVFKVRAVDANDDGIAACDGVPDILLCAGDPDVPDHDATPATSTFRVDATAPNSFLTGGPTEDIRPDWPVSLDPSTHVVLNSNEAAAFRCTLNEKTVGCAQGMVTLSKLKAGPQTFAAAAVDRAGNVDPTPAILRFFVPANLKPTQGTGWKRVHKSGYFGNDYLRASKVGATLVVKKQHHVRELRLIAPAGPTLGVLEVRVGRSQWYRVDLRSARSVRQKTYVVRDQYSSLESGAVTIRVKSLPAGGSAQVDALVARN